MFRLGCSTLLVCGGMYLVRLQIELFLNLWVIQIIFSTVFGCVIVVLIFPCCNCLQDPYLKYKSIIIYYYDACYMLQPQMYTTLGCIVKIVEIVDVMNWCFLYWFLVLYIWWYGSLMSLWNLETVQIIVKDYFYVDLS